MNNKNGPSFDIEDFKFWGMVIIIVALVIATILSWFQPRKPSDYLRPDIFSPNVECGAFDSCRD